MIGPGRWKRVAAAVAAALVGAVAMTFPGARPAAAQDPSATPVAAMHLVDQSVAVAPDGHFGLLLAVDDAPTATEVAIDIYSRAQPGDLLAAEPERDPEATFPVVPLGEPDAGGRRTTGFSIALYRSGMPNPDPAWGYRIDEPGAYPVRVRLLDGTGRQLGLLMTALTRLPAADQATSPTQAALLVPVHEAPPADPQVRAGRDAVDPTLLDALTPVLGALAVRPDLPAAFAVTPDTVARMAGDPAAAEVLGSLRTELGRDGRSLLDAPYVDLDVASLVGAGLTAELAPQQQLGHRTLTELLEEPLGGTWQLASRVDERSLAALARLGISRAVVAGDAVAGGGATTAPVDLPAGRDAIRASASSERYTLGSAAPDDPILAAHLLLARLATLATSGDGGAPGAVVVTLDPARATVDSLRILLDALLVGTPLYRPATLNAVLASAPAPAGKLAPAPQPDLGSYPATVRRARADLDSYRSMVADRTDLVLPYEQVLAVSAADDLDLDQREADAASVHDQLQVPFSSVSLPPRDKVTIGARDASIPLPITSSLDYPVQVVIELQANDRLEFPYNRIETTVADERMVVPVDVHIRTAGDTPVRITLRSPDDGVILAESQYTIRSTAVSGVGVVLTVGAAAFLALWWGRHWHRERDRARHARRRGPRRATPV